MHITSTIAREEIQYLSFLKKKPTTLKNDFLQIPII